MMALGSRLTSRSIRASAMQIAAKYHHAGQDQGHSGTASTTATKADRCARLDQRVAHGNRRLASRGISPAAGATTGSGTLSRGADVAHRT